MKNTFGLTLAFSRNELSFCRMTPFVAVHSRANRTVSGVRIKGIYTFCKCEMHIRYQGMEKSSNGKTFKIASAAALLLFGFYFRIQRVVPAASGGMSVRIQPSPIKTFSLM